MTPKQILIKSISFIIDYFRQLLGLPGCCIYTTTCRDYAKHTLHNRSIFIAIPIIIIRVISCNPITAIFLKIKHRKKNR